MKSPITGRKKESSLDVERDHPPQRRGRHRPGGGGGKLHEKKDCCRKGGGKKGWREFVIGGLHARRMTLSENATRCVIITWKKTGRQGGRLSLKENIEGGQKGKRGVLVIAYRDKPRL